MGNWLDTAGVSTARRSCWSKKDAGPKSLCENGAAATSAPRSATTALRGDPGYAARRFFPLHRGLTPTANTNSAAARLLLPQSQVRFSTTFSKIEFSHRLLSPGNGIVCCRIAPRLSPLARREPFDKLRAGSGAPARTARVLSGLRTLTSGKFRQSYCI